MFEMSKEKTLSDELKSKNFSEWVKSRAERQKEITHTIYVKQMYVRAIKQRDDQKRNERMR